MVTIPADLDLQDPGDGFDPARRAIFAYDLGGGRPDYRGDPLAIEARHEAALADVNQEAIRQYFGRKGLTWRLLGIRKLLPVAQVAFALPAFDEAGHPDGLTAGDLFGLLDRFSAFQEGLRRKYRRESEMIATYGPMPGRAHTYEREVGLWLNRSRTRAFAALAHWRGAIAASGSAKVDFDIVDAMAACHEAALELEADLENDRQEAVARADDAARRNGR